MMRRRVLALPLWALLLSVSIALTGCQSALQSPAAASSPTALPTSAAAGAAIPASTPATPEGSPIIATPEGGATATVAAAPRSVQVVPQPGTGAGVIADVAAATRPGVVEVTNEQLTFNQLRGQMPVPRGIGSGFIIDQEGHILTNNHVVAGAQRILVSLPDGRSFPATLIGRDPRSDLAVIQIQGSNLPVIPLGDSSKLVIGQWVVAIGNALGLEGGPTVTAGVISALGRTVQEPQSQTGLAPFLFDVIQISAPINPGNSGGPLVNLDGQVVGINTLAIIQAEQGVPAQAVNFAIAINTAKPIADELIRTGQVTYAYLGVSVFPNDPALASRFNLPNKPGMIVTDLDANGPAAKAGLRAGDVITEVDGHALKDPSELFRVLAAHKPGDTIRITVARGNQTLQFTVTLGTAPATS